MSVDSNGVCGPQGWKGPGNEWGDMSTMHPLTHVAFICAVARTVRGWWWWCRKHLIACAGVRCSPCREARLLKIYSRDTYPTHRALSLVKAVLFLFLRLRYSNCSPFLECFVACYGAAHKEREPRIFYSRGFGTESMRCGGGL